MFRERSIIYSFEFIQSAVSHRYWLVDRVPQRVVVVIDTVYLLVVDDSAGARPGVIRFCVD